MLWGAMLKDEEALERWMCPACCAKLQKNLSDFVLSFIRSILGYFGLPTLEELEALRKADLGVYHSQSEDLRV